VLLRFGEKIRFKAIAIEVLLRFGEKIRFKAIAIEELRAGTYPVCECRTIDSQFTMEVFYLKHRTHRAKSGKFIALHFH
jgi:hypothetical protein